MLLVDIWLLLAVNPPSIFFMIDGRSQMGAEAKHGLGDTRSLGNPVYKPSVLDLALISLGHMSCWGQQTGL